jgi:predicted nucleic acid-binding Zn ribbon protein
MRRPGPVACGEVALEAGVWSARDRVDGNSALIRCPDWAPSHWVGGGGARGPAKAGAARRREERSGGAKASSNRNQGRAINVAVIGGGVAVAKSIGEVRPESRSDGTDAGQEWPVAIVGLPPSRAMAGGVQPRGRGGVELPCLVCGELFMALRVDRRTCSPACARRDRANRAAAKPEQYGRACEVCGRALVAGRADKRFCSSRCRVRAHRRRQPMTSIEDRVGVPVGRLPGP